MLGPSVYEKYSVRLLYTRFVYLFDAFVCRERRGPREHVKLPLREAGPPNHHDDKVDSDQ